MVLGREVDQDMAEASRSTIEELENIFCLLSGEHSTLPQAEVEAILESEGHPARIQSRLSRVLRLRSTISGAEAIARRAAYTRWCCREIFVCEAEENQVLKAVGTSQFHQFLNQNESFKVEAVKIEPKALLGAKRMEGKIGRAILDSVPNARVNLERSVKTFLGVIVDKSFLLGLVIEGLGSRYASRRPHLRPFFHPSAMLPKLARCMVNLSRAKPGSIFLDAFCGTGSQLIEAALMGCTVLGSDVDPRMVRGAAQNLCSVGIEGYHLLIADAKDLPFRSFASCASDPPYGRGSSTHGMDARHIVEGFLGEVFDILALGSHVCLAFPRDGNIGDLGRGVGYEVLESHLVREHKSLTREIVVLRRP